MDVAQPGRAIGRSFAALAGGEHELTRLIERRHDRRAASRPQRPAEDLWAASERTYFARRDEERCLELLTFHEGQAAQELPSALGAVIRKREHRLLPYVKQLQSTEGVPSMIRLTKVLMDSYECRSKQSDGAHDEA